MTSKRCMASWIFVPQALVFQLLGSNVKTNNKNKKTESQQARCVVEFLFLFSDSD